ncbi:hypothetical protein BGX26_000915, partial [Mortierella sp. AD094]
MSANTQKAGKMDNIADRSLQSADDSSMMSEHDDGGHTLSKPMRAAATSRSEHQEYKIAGEEFGGTTPQKSQSPAGSGYSSPLVDFIARDMIKEPPCNSHQTLEHQIHIGLDTPTQGIFSPFSSSHNSSSSDLAHVESEGKNISGNEAHKELEFKTEDFPKSAEAQDNNRQSRHATLSSPTFGGDSKFGTIRQTPEHKRSVDPKKINDTADIKKIATPESYSDYRGLEPALFKHNVEGHDTVPHDQTRQAWEPHSHHDRHSLARNNSSELSLGSLFHEGGDKSLTEQTPHTAASGNGLGLMTTRSEISPAEQAPLFQERTETSTVQKVPSIKRRLSAQLTSNVLSHRRSSFYADEFILNAAAASAGSKGAGPATAPVVVPMHDLLHESSSRAAMEKKKQGQHNSDVAYPIGSHGSEEQSSRNKSPNRSFFQPSEVMPQEILPATTQTPVEAKGTGHAASTKSASVPSHRAVTLHHTDIPNYAAVKLHHSELPAPKAAAPYHSHTTATLHHSELPVPKAAAPYHSHTTATLHHSELPAPKAAAPYHSHTTATLHHSELPAPKAAAPYHSHTTATLHHSELPAPKAAAPYHSHTTAT